MQPGDGIHFRAKRRYVNHRQNYLELRRESH